MATINITNEPAATVTHGCDFVLVETSGGDITITNSYVGVRFVSDDGEILSVSMRDGGFEVRYASNANGPSFQDLDLKNGEIKSPQQ